LTYLPLCAVAPATTPIVSARGRYATPRRGELDYEADLWDIAMAFGIPGTWVNLDRGGPGCVCGDGRSHAAGECDGVGIHELEIVYTAGFDPIPDKVKVACAQLVKNAQATPATECEEECC
jgi:hypothetical protein